MSPQLVAYLLDCELRGLSPQTRTLYKSQLERFESENIGDIALLMKYLDHYTNPRTRHGHWRAIATFIRWCAKLGLGQDWIGAAHMKCQLAPPPAVLSDSDFNRLLGAIPGSLDGKRDKALFTFIWHTGCRRGAAIGLKWADIDISGRWAKIKTKGGKEQQVPLTRSGARELNIWRLKCPQSEWVFPSIRHPQRSVEAHHISRRLRQYAKQAGFDRRVWVHLLRHSFATMLSEQEVPTEVIQAALGHSSINTTARYINRLTAPLRVRAAVDKVFA